MIILLLLLILTTYSYSASASGNFNRRRFVGCLADRRAASSGEEGIAGSRISSSGARGSIVRGFFTSIESREDRTPEEYEKKRRNFYPSLDPRAQLKNIEEKLVLLQTHFIVADLSFLVEPMISKKDIVEIIKDISSSLVGLKAQAEREGMSKEFLARVDTLAIESENVSEESLGSFFTVIAGSD